MSKTTSIDYLKHFAAVSTQMPNGIELLQAAINDKNFEINRKDSQGKTLLFQAVEKGWIMAAKILLETKANPQITDKEGYTPLHKAVEIPNASLVKLLIDYKASVDVPNNGKLTPIWIAIITGFNKQESKSDVLKILDLLHNANFEAQLPNKILLGKSALSNSHNQIPFFFLCSVSLHDDCRVVCKEMGEKLLSLKPINPDIKDSRGWGYMHWLTCVKDSLKLLDEVFKQGCNINAQDNEGHTCLHLTGVLNPSLIEWFALHGADFSVINKLGQTPLSKAYQLISENRDSPKIATICMEISVALLLNGHKYGTLKPSIKNFEYAVKLKVLEEFLSNVEHQKTINTKFENNSTYLHYAAKDCSSDLVYKLIKMKADVNAINSEGYTPLHEAAISKNNKAYEIAEALVANGAEACIIAKDGSVPLTLASKSGNKKFVQILLNKVSFVINEEFLNSFVDLGLTNDSVSGSSELSSEFITPEISGNQPNLFN